MLDTLFSVPFVTHQPLVQSSEFIQIIQELKTCLT